MKKEAKVEVLTAEVRVLMVGSRQITRSVAKQLDSISWAKIKAFGRVRIDNVGTEIIGADDSGILCTAFLGSLEPRFLMTHDEALEYFERLDYRDVVKADEKGEKLLRYSCSPDGIPLLFALNRSIPVNLGSTSGSFRCKDVAGFCKKAIQIEEEYKRLKRIADELRGLPLIVLAGLH